jgi:ABC-2 type transport system ATP-binding protein
MEEADSLCDRVAIIDHGRIVAQGTPRDLKAALGGDLVTLVAGPGARKAIEALPFVRKVEERGNALVLTVADAGTNLGRIIQAVGHVESVEVRPARLEDVFLAHTGRGLRDASEGGEDYFDQWVRTQSGGSG